MYRQHCLIGIFLALSHYEAAIVTTRDRLYSYIFQNYNTYGFPTLDHSTATRIGVECFIISLNQFDEISGELAVTLYFKIQWTEERISWNISDFGGVDTLVVSPTHIWKPNLFIVQSSDKMQQIGNMSMFLRLMSHGLVIWTPADEFKISCSVDVTYFPFDQQTCQIEFTGIVYSASELALYSENNTLQRSFLTNNSQWDILPSEVFNCTKEGGPSCIEIDLKLKRKSMFYIVYILVPLLFLGTINNLVFVMPANSGERNSVAITTFLSFVVYMGIVNDLVPQSSSPLSYLYLYLMFLMVYSSSIMFLCIVSLRIYNLEGCYPVPCLVKAIVIIFRCKCLRYFVRKRMMNKVKVLPKEKLDKIYQNGINSKDSQNGSKLDDGARKISKTFEVPEANIERDDKIQTKEIMWCHVGRTFDIFWFTILYLTYFIGSGATFTILYLNIWLK